jgi:hypothetical protein
VIIPVEGIELAVDHTDRSRRRSRQMAIALIVLVATVTFASVGCGGSGRSSCNSDNGCLASTPRVDEPVNLSVEALPGRPVGTDSSVAKEIERHEKACEGGACLALPPLTVATSIAGTIAEEARSSADASDPSRSCPLTPTETIGALPMQIPACLLVASDTSAEADEEPFWGELACANSSRYEHITNGGDPRETAAAKPQDNTAFRQLTVLDGDEVYGERCELGENNNDGGPTVFYHGGEHLVTYFSERLPANFPLDTEAWQTVMQMKQAQPADNGGGAPILEMEARDGRWIVDADWHELWSAPARKETWTRFAWDVYYSKTRGQGWLQVSIDLNGDGDFEDPGERSPVFHVATLKTEIEGPNGASDGLVAGQPIPSHLRMGIYHDPVISCPAPKGCSVDVDNVQVFAPSPLEGG